MKQELKNVASKVFNAISYSAVFLLIILGTIAIYYYANGYRFDFSQGEVEKTGVLTVESIPSRANLIVNGEQEGTTPKTITFINEGVAEVEVSKDDYVTWTKTVPIKAEKTSPIFPYLIRKDPKVEIAYSSNEQLIKAYTSADSDYIFFITRTDDIYTIWRYDTTRNFWDLTENPNDIYSIADPTITDISLSISPDGRAALLTVVTVDTETEEKSTDISLLHTVRNGVVIEDLDLESFLGTYKFYWSNDSKFVLLESSDDIVTLKISDRTKYLILKKSEGKKYVWTTDTNGFFYLVTQKVEKDIKYYTLSQMLLDGTEKTTLIDKIYSQETDLYIKEIREEPMNYIPFTNAPENTRFSGEISAIAVDQETGGLYIQTTAAGYWYNNSLEKYILVNPYSSKFVSFSPDKTRLIFQNADDKSTGVFTFDKEENDHVTAIGSKTIIETPVNKGGVKWLENGRAVTYRTDEDIRIVDVDGDNDTKLTDITDYPAIVDGKNKYLYKTVVNEETNKLSIEKLQIN